MKRLESKTLTMKVISNLNCIRQTLELLSVSTSVSPGGDAPGRGSMFFMPKMPIFLNLFLRSRLILNIT